MAHPNVSWSTIHASVYRNAGAILRPAAATTRARGAVRYRCPVTGSFVLVTDDASLGRLNRPIARARCVSCNEIHLVTSQ